MTPAHRGYFASRAELSSALGEVEKCYDGIFNGLRDSAKNSSATAAVGALWMSRSPRVSYRRQASKSPAHDKPRPLQPPSSLLCQSRRKFPTACAAGDRKPWGLPYHLLRCYRALSAGDADAGNLLAQGDNLLALKAAGKVKCTYIDPPHNTGNENGVYVGAFGRGDEPRV